MRPLQSMVLSRKLQNSREKHERPTKSYQEQIRRGGVNVLQPNFAICSKKHTLQRPLMDVLVSGSLAYDCLFDFTGTFTPKTFNSAHISAAFNVANKAVHFGGCAGNIVFNAALLKEKFALLGIAGKDFGDYEKWLASCGIDTKYVIRRNDEYCSQAVVATDKKGQQIIFFHEGAASKAHLHKKEIIQSVKFLKSKGVGVALVSPNSKDFMLATIEGCFQAQISFFFDPGQAMPLFSGKELRDILSKAAGVFLNQYEFEKLLEKTGIKLDELVKSGLLVVVTLAEKGSEIYFGKNHIKVSAVKPKNIVEPTGCGDAYRAGFLSVIKNDFPNLSERLLKQAGRLGSKLATACLESVGTQNHEI